MRFFDYIWYRTFLFYTSKNDDIPKISTSFFLGMIQSMNTLTFFFILEYLLIEPLVNNIIGVSIAFSFVFLNMIRYREKRIAKIITSWENEKVSKKKWGFYSLLYIIISLIIIVTVASFIGSLNHEKVGYI